MNIFGETLRSIEKIWKLTRLVSETGNYENIDIDETSKESGGNETAFVSEIESNIFGYNFFLNIFLSQN